MVDAVKAWTAELLVARGRVPVVLTDARFVGGVEGDERRERICEGDVRRIKGADDREGALPVPASWKEAALARA